MGRGKGRREGLFLSSPWPPCGIPSGIRHVALLVKDDSSELSSKLAAARTDIPLRRFFKPDGRIGR